MKSIVIRPQVGPSPLSLVGEGPTTRGRVLGSMGNTWLTSNRVPDEIIEVDRVSIGSLGQPRTRTTVLKAKKGMAATSWLSELGMARLRVVCSLRRIYK